MLDVDEFCKLLLLRSSISHNNNRTQLLAGFFVFCICNIIKIWYIYIMKKGSKLNDTQYFLEIRDLQYRPVYLGGGLSLREAVRLTSEHVTDMDNYSKVYRELKAMQGAFIGLYFAQLGKKEPTKVFVLIQGYFKPSAEQEQQALAEAEQLESDITAGKIEIPD